MNLSTMLDKKIDDLFMNKLRVELEKKVSIPVKKKISDNIWSERTMNVFFGVEEWLKYVIGR